METRKQIAARLGIKLTRLSTTLSIRQFEATEVQVINGRTTHLYDENRARQIEAMFKKKPKGDANA